MARGGRSGGTRRAVDGGPGVNRGRFALLIALGVDDFGSGMFLPLALVYVTRVVGLPLGLAGTVVAAGTVIGLLVPPVGGRAVDRVGPRAVVIFSQLVQALGVVSYLLADGVAMTVVAAVLLAGGQQLFYCSLFSLIADVAGEGPTDRPFAMVGMVRSAGFGLGSLAAGLLLSLSDLTGLQIAVALDAMSFLVCGVLLAVSVRVPHAAQRGSSAAADGTDRGPLHDRPYLLLIGVTMLCIVTTDFFMVGLPVYILDELHGPRWLPGAVLVLHTAVISSGGTAAVRFTRGMARTRAMSFGAALYAGWSVAGLAALVVAPSWRPAWLLGCTVLVSVGTLLVLTRANSVAEAAAPRARRGQYLAAFQYAFTVAQVLAPAIVALFTIKVWLPWVLVALAAALASYGMRWITPRLPEHAVYPRPAPVPAPVSAAE